MARSRNQDLVFSLLYEKPIAYHGGLAKVFGVKTAVLLSQLLYWQGKGSHGDWTYKTLEEMWEETGLSRSEQDGAIAVCKSAGFLQVKRAGVPPKRHFRLDVPLLCDVLAKNYPSCKSNSRKPANRNAGSTQNNTESTSKNTTNRPSYSFGKLKGEKLRRDIRKLAAMKRVK